MTEQNDASTENMAVRGYGRETSSSDEPLNRSRSLFELREQLRDSQENLTGSQAEIDNKQKYVSTLQAEISALEKASQLIDTAVEGYEGAYQDLQDEANELDDFADRKLEWVENKLPTAVRRTIDDILTEIRDKTQKVREEKERLEEKPKVEPTGREDSVRAAEIGYEQAQQRLETAQRAFDEFAGLQKWLEDGFKTAEGLKKSIEQEDDKENPNLPNMYVLIQDLKMRLNEKDNGILEKLKKYGLTELSTPLVSKWDDLREALKELRETEYNLNTARSELKSKTAALDGLEKNRQQLIFEKIKGTISW
jgi:chromosome segregation ATPase